MRMLGLKRIGINYEILQPGDRSSWPHAHKEDEEFIFILATLNRRYPQSIDLSWLVGCV